MSTTLRRRSRTGAVRRRRKNTKTILVIQFDSARLEAEGLDLAPFVAAASLVASVNLVRATSLDDLHAQLAELVGRKYDVVATIGHSSAKGIRIAPDRSVSWEAYAEYLKPFEPRRLAIIACLAGQYLPTGKVFAGLPKVRRIYATPALANRMLGTVMVLALPYLLDHAVPDRDLLRFLQFGLALAGRQLWEWRRTEWERNRDDVFAPIAHDLLRQLSNGVIDWISGRQRA